MKDESWRKYWRPLQCFALAFIIGIGSVSTLYGKKGDKNTGGEGDGSDANTSRLKMDATTGGPVLTITNETNRNVKAENIPTKDRGKAGGGQRFSPSEFNPVAPGATKWHDFRANQFHGFEGSMLSIDIDGYDRPLRISYDGNSSVVNDEDIVRVDVDESAGTKTTYMASAEAQWNDNGFRVYVREVNTGTERLPQATQPGTSFNEDGELVDEDGVVIQDTTGYDSSYGSNSGYGQQQGAPSNVEYHYHQAPTTQVTYGPPPPTSGSGAAPAAPSGGTSAAPAQEDVPALFTPQPVGEAPQEDNYWFNQVGGAWESFLSEFGSYW